MKRLCVFYYRADEWLARGKPIEWIVCRECQRRIRAGELSFTTSVIRLGKS